MSQQKRKKAAAAGLRERLRKCCNVGTGECERTGTWQRGTYLRRRSHPRSKRRTVPRKWRDRRRRSGIEVPHEHKNQLPKTSWRMTPHPPQLHAMTQKPTPLPPCVPHAPVYCRTSTALALPAIPHLHTPAEPAPELPLCTCNQTFITRALSSLGRSQTVEKPCLLHAAKLAALKGCGWLLSSRKTIA